MNILKLLNEDIFSVVKEFLPKGKFNNVINTCKEIKKECEMLKYIKLNRKYSLKYYYNEKFREKVLLSIKNLKMQLSITLGQLYFDDGQNYVIDFEDIKVLNGVHILDLSNINKLNVKGLNKVHTLDLSGCKKVKNINTLDGVHTLIMPVKYKKRNTDLNLKNVVNLIHNNDDKICDNFLNYYDDYKIIKRSDCNCIFCKK